MKLHGVRLGQGARVESFSLKEQKAISILDKISRNSIKERISRLEAIEESIGKLDTTLSERS